MTTHAVLSPSSRARWSRCPGSVRESAKYPNESGPAAIDGTHTHTLLEACIKGQCDPLSMIGRQMEDHDGAFVVDRDRAERVKIAVDYIEQRIIENHFNCEVISEERVNPAWFFGRDDMTGTVDIQLHGHGTGVLELIDYKDGVGLVEAKDNEQLEQYGYGVLAKFKLPVNVEYPFHTLQMTIIQPKRALKGLPTISSYAVPVRQFLDRSGTIIAQAHAASQSDAPLVPGEVQCKYCPAKGNCSALTGAIVQKIDIAPLNLAQSAADKNPNELSNEQIREILEAAPLLRQMLESVESEALRRMQDGNDVPGFKLVRGRGTRGWMYDDTQMAEKLLKLGIPKGSLYKETLVSPAQVEKLEWEKRDGTRMKLSENQLKLIGREYITKNQGKLTIAPLSDSREAVIMDASTLFKPIET